MAVITQIQFRRGTAAQWSSTNPTLAAGELGYETDTGNFKIGNGSTAWNSLSVLNGITASTTATFTNKTINLASNTLTGTLAEFNTACSNADFASLAGSETLTNKTLTTPIISSISNTGTITLPTSTDTLVGRATTDTLTNKTISGANNTLSNIGNSSLTNSSVTVNGTAISLGASGTVTVPINTGVTGLGTNVATFLATPTSANLAAALTDETGTGANVFAGAPTLTGTVTASGDINLSATGAFGSLKDYQTLDLMGCL